VPGQASGPATLRKRDDVAQFGNSDAPFSLNAVAPEKPAADRKPYGQEEQDAATEHEKARALVTQGVSPSVALRRASQPDPKPRSRRERRRTEHYNQVFDAVLTDAKAVDPHVDPVDLREEFDDRVNRLEELDQLRNESGRDPHELLLRDARYGGMWWERNTAPTAARSITHRRHERARPR
jgi:hypothetical protein